MRLLKVKIAVDKVQQFYQIVCDGGALQATTLARVNVRLYLGYSAVWVILLYILVIGTDSSGVNSFTSFTGRFGFSVHIGSYSCNISEKYSASFSAYCFEDRFSSA